MEEEDFVFESRFDVESLSHSATENGDLHCYEGLEDGVRTRWITKGQWDGVLRLSSDSYTDGEGREVMVVEEGEDEFEEWKVG